MIHHFKRKRALILVLPFFSNICKQAGDAWFLGSPEQSLGFILADEGFDVWVGSVRGTYWSQGHISLSEKDKVESIEHAYIHGFLILVTLWIDVLVAKSLSIDAKSM